MVCYDPSTAVMRYRGSYQLLRGLEMSQAYAWMLDI
jgi:hypothetical protein